MDINEILNLSLLVMGAAAAGFVGAFALMKRMVLAGDVMSHIAIPGLGIAAIIRINPLIGGGLALLLGILLIWQLQKKTDLSAEAAIGVLFATSVALGALLINSSEELIDALFGGFGDATPWEFVLGTGASVVIMGIIWAMRHTLILSLFSPELAEATGVNVHRANLWFLLCFGLAILVSLRFLGALLVGSLIIIPAAAARQLTHTLGKFLIASVCVSVLAVLVGFGISGWRGLDFGPTAVVTAAVFFAASLLRPQK